MHWHHWVAGKVDEVYIPSTQRLRQTEYRKKKASHQLQDDSPNHSVTLDVERLELNIF